MNNYDFKLYDKSLKYPAAYDPKTFMPMIPAGATGVEIARGQSSKTFFNKKTGKVENQMYTAGKAPSTTLNNKGQRK